MSVALENNAARPPVAAEDPAAIFETCVSCGICRDACPTFTELFELSERRRAGGPLDLIRENAVSLLGSCTSCGVCERNCPLEFRIGGLAFDRRATATHERAREGDPVRLAGLSRVLGNRLVHSRPGRRLAERLVGIDRRRPLPGFAGAAERALLPGGGKGDAAGAPVTVVVDELSERAYPEHVAALFELLVRSGRSVRMIELPARAMKAFHRGDLPELLRIVEERLVHTEGDLVCVDSDATSLLRWAATKESSFSDVPGSAAESCTYVLELIESGDLGSAGESEASAAAVVTAASAHALGTTGSASRLLHRVPGLRVKRVRGYVRGPELLWGSASKLDGELAFNARVFASLKAEAAANAVLTVTSAAGRLALEHAGAVRVTHPIVLYRDALSASSSSEASPVASLR